MNKTALAELGMKTGTSPLETQKSKNTDTSANLYPLVENDKDYFQQKDGVRYAGTHLLIDLWGASGLDDIAHVEAALREGAEASGATILHCHLHRFQPNGVSGVLVLAESHISIHTWPEESYAALDVFMCGECDPHKALPVLRKAFTPARIDVDEQLRGKGV